jgi:hypothetical protein
MFRIGDLVEYSNPNYPRWNPGTGTVMRITGKRVVVKWDRYRSTNCAYAEHNLKLLQRANAGEHQPTSHSGEEPQHKDGESC